MGTTAISGTPIVGEDYREQLARTVFDAFQSAFTKLAEHKREITQLRYEFSQLNKDERIMNCRSWTEFCQNVLRRSIRTVQYMLTGGNPVSKRKTRETVSRHATAPAPADENASLTSDTYSEQKRRMLKNAAILAELVADYEHGRDITSLIKQADKVIFTPDELEAMREFKEGKVSNYGYSSSSTSQSVIRC